MKIAKVTKAMTQEQVKALVANKELSTSAKVRQMFEAGMEIKEMASLLNIRYNFAYNVIQNYTIVNDIDVKKAERDSKRPQIIELFIQGKSLADISRATKTNYNYVWKIVDEHKQEVKAKEEKAKASADANKDEKKDTKKEVKAGAHA
jgi:hypothetical protein